MRMKEGLIWSIQMMGGLAEEIWRGNQKAPKEKIRI